MKTASEKGKQYRAKYPEEVKKYRSQYEQLNKEKIALYKQAYFKTPKGRYSSQKCQALKRQIPWLFTFESWWKVWESSGKWEQRGTSGYVMTRYKDTGPYSPENVFIKTCQENTKEYWNEKAKES